MRKDKQHYKHIYAISEATATSASFQFPAKHAFQSSNNKLLKIPECNFTFLGDCSFSFIAPFVWNSLPVSLRNLSLTEFKTSSRFSSLDRPFRKPRQPIPVTTDYVCVCAYARVVSANELRFCFAKRFEL